MDEYKSFYKEVKDRKFNTWCRWTTRLDTYGKGCAHNCSYCYAKSLLSFRGLWDPNAPGVADIEKIRRRIQKMKPGIVVRLGGMTDCFQPCEAQYRNTFRTIEELNRCGIGYLIVTKSDMIADPAYLGILDPKLAHVQITITTTDDRHGFEYEHTASTARRIEAIEKLEREGLDVSVRLSPFIPEFIDLNVVNDIRCDKILIEFLKVNAFIKKNFDIDYSPYTLKYGEYYHLQLEDKIKHVERLTGFKERSVGEYVKEHYEYFRDNFNANPEDCCNLRKEK